MIPYWASWLILIAGLVGAFGLGWSIGTRRGEIREDEIRIAYAKQFLKLRCEADERRAELTELITDMAIHFEQCHELKGTTHDRPRDQTQV